MSFYYQNQCLYVDQVKLSDIAKTYGTPLFVYSLSQLRSNYLAFAEALHAQPHLICYAVKASSNIALLHFLAQLGCGFDIVSLGELRRVLAAGGDAKKIVFSGVGKTKDEIRNALHIGILCFNVESAPELERIEAIAKELGVIAPISIRVNPNIEAKTHPYIATGMKTHKFGVDSDTALTLYQKAQQSAFLNIQGIDCHIGSQLTSLQPFLDALAQVLQLIEKLKTLGIHIPHLNLGGGLGVRYQDETPPSIAAYGSSLVETLKGHNVHLILEPGRAIVANTGVLLTQVEYLKHAEEKSFALIDAGMNDLLRPALYDAWHDILPLTQHPQMEEKTYDVVGPVCESGDFFAKARALKIKEQDTLAVMNAGAYGFTMSSNYNTRPRAAEVAVLDDKVYLIREREQYSDLLKHEHLLPF